MYQMLASCASCGLVSSRVLALVRNQVWLWLGLSLSPPTLSSPGCEGASSTRFDFSRRRYSPSSSQLLAMDLPTAQPTRLLLTNLPPSLTTPLLRAHLQRCPPFPPALTDLKILLKPDGTSRRIAFVGFKETTEADRVRKWVDGTWVQGSSGGSSVRVEWAKEVGFVPPTVESWCANPFALQH